MENLVYIVVWVISVIAFLIASKIIGGDSTKEIVMKTNLIVQYADAFVSWARQFKTELSGNEKMDAVVNKLKKITNRYDIEISEDELKAIIQKAYDNMKNKDDTIKSISNSGQTAIYTVGEIIAKEDTESDKTLPDFDPTTIRISE